MEFLLRHQNKNFSELTIEEKVENLKDRIARAQQGLAPPKKVNVQPTIRQEPVRSEADAMKAKLLGLKK
jgi:hypothetical protein